MASGECVPRDEYGPLPGTCSAGFGLRCHNSHDLKQNEEKIHAGLRTVIGDLQPDGMPFDTNLERGAKVLRIPVRRGLCYGLVWRTSYEVDDPQDLNATAKVESDFIAYEGGWQDPTGATFYVHASGAATLSPFCPVASGAIAITIAPTMSQKGTWRVQLFSKPIAEKALQTRVKELETIWRQAKVRVGCRRCVREFASCKLEGESNCTKIYHWCLGEQHLTELDCERGDTAPPKPAEAPKLPSET